MYAAANHCPLINKLKGVPQSIRHVESTHILNILCGSSLLATNVSNKSLYCNAHFHYCTTLSSHHHTVTNLTAVNTTTNSFIITWDEPDEKYNVWLYGEATDNIPQNRFIDLIDVTGQTTLSIGGLNSFRNYSISVYLETEMGNGSDATVTVQTLGRGECVCVCVCVCVHVTE